MSLRELGGLVMASVLVGSALILALRQRNNVYGRQHLDPNRRALLRVGAVLGIGLAGLATRLLAITVTNADQISTKRGVAPDGDVLSNPRLISRQIRSQRGRILDRNGEVLASSEEADAVWERLYPVSEAAHILGFFSPLRFGTAGVEDSRDGTLAGGDPLTVTEAIDAGLFLRTMPGHDVRLTIDLELQRLAASLLQDVTGSAILLDHQTGRILAMASSPAYDPQALVAVREADLPGVDAAWAALQAAPNDPLLLRTTQGLYPPGSTFKVLTAAAAIDSGVVISESVFADDGSLNVDGYIIPEFNRPDDSQTEWTVREGIMWSLNVVFAQIGLALGGVTLAEYASRFGIGRSTPFELPTAAGQLAGSADALASEPALAATAFGQGELLVTPLQMAGVMAAIANGGVIQRPILVDAVLGSDGQIIAATERARFSLPVSAETAATMLDLLYDSVTYGYASGAQILGLKVAGKTGTAESGKEAPHGWFIGSAGVDEPTVTVAVCLDYGGEGGGLPLQIGRQMLDAAVTR